MAVSGRRLGGSVKESDYLYECPCSPCGKDGRNVEAIKHCADCNENLCSTCLTHHNKFAMMRGHAMSDQVQTNQGQTKQLPSQRCNKHGGKIIDVFCPEHDAVGCSSCISIDHSSCKGKQFIPDVASGIKTSKELKQLKTEVKTLEVKLESLKKLKGDNLERLKQDKEALKKEIQSVRKKINEQLDKMEKQLVDEADAKFKEKIDAVHASIAEVDGMLANIKEAMVHAKDDNNDADIFVTCKMLKQKMCNEVNPLHNIIVERPHERSLELHTGDYTRLIMEGSNMFASILEKYTIQGIEYKGDINISLVDDQNVCKVYAMCDLPDGSFVMADYNNKTLKKLDTASNYVSNLINLPDNPIGACLVDNNRLAVSLIHQKKIQFVSLSGKVKLDNSFLVGDRCRGLAHCDGLLYLCCGGCPNGEEGCGHVEIYNCSGELLRCLYEEFSRPDYIYMVKNGNNNTMYISDRFKGVHTRGIDGSVKHKFPTALDSDRVFCLVGNDQLCVAECSTGDVFIQTYTCKSILLEKMDDKGKPACLYFDERSSLLFVALSNCDIIQVFKIKM